MEQLSVTKVVSKSCMMNKVLLVSHRRAQEDTQSCRSESAVSASSQRPLVVGGWTLTPQIERKKNGGEEWRNGCSLRRRRKRRSRRRWWEERRRGWGQWRGATVRRREKAQAREETPAGRWSGCDSAGHSQWEGGKMMPDHSLLAEASPARQPTSES